MNTRRELVRRAIEFANPWRMPICSSPSVTTFADDVVFVFPIMKGNAWWTGTGGYDEWGCKWELSPDTKDMGQISEHPLKDLHALDSFPRPDGFDPARYARLESEIAQAEDRYITFCNGTCLFERAHMQRGFAQFLEDLYDDPEGVDALLDVIIQYQLDSVDYLATHFSGKIHGFRVTDDWGTQQGPIISPAKFREHFFPRYQKLFSRVRAAGMNPWLHSCGKHDDLLDQLVEAGLQVVNLCQPTVFDIPAFGKRFAGRIAFESSCDQQTTLVAGDPQAIRKEASDLITHWTTDRGGWLLMKEFDTAGNGINPACRPIMTAAFTDADRWAKKGG